ncbi:glyoxalase family protein [Carnobacterium maltaromaticum]|nr:glyoxalase family protein [Carnobacterium maltaromaticum]
MKVITKKLVGVIHLAKIYPYLAFDSAKEALDYYTEVFGATDIIRLPVSPEQATQFGISAEKLADTTMHASFTVLGAPLFCADNFMGPVQSSNQVSIMLDINSEDAQAAHEADAFYQKIAASGQAKITMPFEEQFWGGKMGQLVDKYGITWMLHSQPYSKINLNTK